MNLSARLLGSSIEIYQRIHPIWVKFDFNSDIISESQFTISYKSQFMLETCLLGKKQNESSQRQYSGLAGKVQPECWITVAAA